MTASEVIPSFPIATMASTMSRSAEGFVTVSELVHGVTTSRITPSTLTVPSGLALAYGYANISYTGPRDSFHLPNPIFPPMRLSRVSGETAKGDARPDFSPLIPSIAPHVNLDTNLYTVNQTGVPDEFTAWA